VLLLSFMTHELAHAFTAYRCGDNTAKEMGRISFNPIRHIDPIGAILLLAVGFGWAKPVPINPDNFRKKKAGIILTSLAGPLSNILLAIIFSSAYVIFMSNAVSPYAQMTDAQMVARNLLIQFYVINITLAAFNLIPIPPLDGSKVVFSLLPDRIYYGYILRYERYGMFLLIGLSITGILSTILTPVINYVSDFVNMVIVPLTAPFIK